MRAFHKDPKVKEKYIERVRSHQIADEIIKGQYWENGKGCAVGCTVHSSNHNSYEDELGIPRWLARLQDKLFEGMSNEDAKLFPLKFLEAIPLGVDLEKSKAPFFVFLLQTVLTDFDNYKYPEQARAINNVIVLYKENCEDANRWSGAGAGAAAYAAYAADAARSSAAADAAYAAAASAYAASYAAAASASAAAYAADASYAADAAADAAAGAASDAGAAAGAAAYDAGAACSAACSAAYAAYAADAYASARRKRHKLLADKLLEIFKTLEES